MGKCMLCPRRCGADRERGERGFCRMPREIRVADAALHFFEEPPISGTRGSGAVFFAGCPLGCIFCQNREISRPACPPPGRVLEEAELGALFLALQEKGAHNINLVTPTHYADRVANALSGVRAKLKIPVVYNSSGYELPETLRLFEGLVDIYLPDFKYVSPELSAAYSAAADYGEAARGAIAEMFRQTGRAEMEGGLLKKGVVVRHLVLPGCRKDSLTVLHALAELLPMGEFYLSLMSQYTPEFADETAPQNLKRRVTAFEYDSVLQKAAELGFAGFMQGRSSAASTFTPNFSASRFAKTGTLE